MELVNTLFNYTAEIERGGLFGDEYGIDAADPDAGNKKTVVSSSLGMRGSITWGRGGFNYLLCIFFVGSIVLFNYMTEAKEKYLQTIDDFENITSIAWNISVNTQGCDVGNWRVEYCSYMFTKLCLHAQAILQLKPELGDKESSEISTWDISSICTLIRALIETYYVFFYLGIDEASDDEIEFRYQLWQYHGEKQRLDMLKLMKFNSSTMSELEKNLEKLEESLVDNKFYKTLKSSRQQEIRRGKVGILSTNSQLSEKAGINPDYYKSNYKYLSAYVHAFPFAYSQLKEFRAGQDESLRIIKTNLDVCTGYICHAVRDFLKIMPDQEKYLDQRARTLIEDWECIFKHET